MPRYRAIAAQNLSAAVIDVEAIHGDSGYRKRTGLRATGRPGKDDPPRMRHATLPGLGRGIRLGQHVRRELGRHKLPSALTIPRRSNRPHALNSRAVVSSARRRRHSTRSSSRSRSRSSKLASGTGTRLAGSPTQWACPTCPPRAKLASTPRISRQCHPHVRGASSLAAGQ